MATSYQTENLIGGEIKTDQIPLKAGTYYRGMPLKYTAGSDYYEYDSTVALSSAIYLGNSQGAAETIGTNGDHMSCIVGGEIQEGGIVNNSNVAITITEDMINALNVNGLYIKRS